jgi:pyridoxamine 5'-phosphate oxidase family protein
MSAFTSAEVGYLNGQQLGRLATAGADGRPHVVPVAFQCNTELGTIDIGGHGFTGRKKWRDVQANPWAAFVVDDVVSVSPWSPRMLEIRGRVELLTSGGSALRPGFDEEMIRIHPTRIISYGLEHGQQSASARSVRD